MLCLMLCNIELAVGVILQLLAWHMHMHGVAVAWLELSLYLEPCVILRCWMLNVGTTHIIYADSG